MPIVLTRFLPALVSRLAPILVWLGVLGLGAWFTAGWYWRMAGPEVTDAFPAPLSDPGRAGEEIASRHLFGLAQKSSSEPSSPARLSIHVIGVMTASRNGPGFAVIQDQGGSTLPILEGEEIAPGLKLERVMPQGIEISQNGRKETLALESGQKLPAVPIQGLPSGSTPPQIQQAPSPQPDPSVAGTSFRKPRLSPRGDGTPLKNEHDPDD